jgi:hypothetical protein
LKGQRHDLDGIADPRRRAMLFFDGGWIEA